MGFGRTPYDPVERRPASRLEGEPFHSVGCVGSEVVGPLVGDGKKYTPHSFRRGLYTTAFHAGMFKDDVRKYGNWASDACELYYAMTSQRVYAMFTGRARSGPRRR